jgi:4-phosphopantoate--beta-alanine ligase
MITTGLTPGTDLSFAPALSRSVEVSKDHPRYRSLVTREHMAQMVKEGIVAPTGLIAHGRGEAFDYLIGERTTEEARRADWTAAALLLEARRPVISVNGNTAALCAEDLIRLAEAIPAVIEVNLFHWSRERMEAVCAFLERAGAKRVLGREQDALLPGIASDRARCTKEGIFSADVVLVPLEDGDRAEALIKAGKRIVSVDLNPLSRAAQAATVTIVDEVTRAIPLIIESVDDLKRDSVKRRRIIGEWDNSRNLAAALGLICERLRAEAKAITTSP